jgi:hypothetical protein
MVVVPLSKPAEEANAATLSVSSKPTHWVGYLAAGTLAAGGALLISGQRRAGLVAAVSGATLAMLDQQDVVRAWWSRLPGFLAEMHATLERAQGAVEDLSAQGEKLRQALGH